MTKEKEIVADPFLGSGTTIIASEKKQIVYAMEWKLTHYTQM